MSNIKVSLDYVTQKTKPKGSNIGQISNRIAKSVEYLNPSNIRSFVKKVSEHGQTFCQTTFINGSRNKDNFEQMQLMVLDFDEGVTLKEILDRTQQYNLPILFAYDTFSSIDNNRFRIAFLNDIPITDIKVAKVAQNALVTIFPEADNGSRDISRMYFGGKELLYFDKSIPKIDIESLTRNMSLYLKDKYGDTHYKRKISEFAKNNCIALNKNNMLDILVVENVTEQFGKNSPNPIIVLKQLVIIYQIYIIRLILILLVPAIVLPIKKL